MTSVPQHHYLVYKITNKINGKTYIGCHKTKIIEDGYMGSGKYLKRAQAKYGIENFKKEILFDFESSEEMFSRERELIAEMKPEYNLHEGGLGGWDYVNQSGKNVQIHILNKRYGYSAAHQRALKKERIAKYDTNPKLCIQCSTAIPYESRVNTFCSRSCSATYNNKKRTDSGWAMPTGARNSISETLMKYYGVKPEFCRVCDKRITRGGVTGLCKPCLRINNLPPEFVLIIDSLPEMRSVMSSREIGEMYGVSHKTVLRYSNTVK